MVFLFDSNKVQFKHIAGEIVLPKTSLVEGEQQFARSPFLVRFQSGWFKFYLCTVHLYYGDTSGEGYARRVAEIDAIAKFLKKRADEGGPELHPAGRHERGQSQRRHDEGSQEAQVHPARRSDLG